MSIDGEKSSYVFDGLRLDPGRRQLYGTDGKPVQLRAKAFDTLLYLVERAGQLVPKNELLSAVWPDSVVEENNLNQTISALRQLLGDDRLSPRFIATVTGRGYQFVADVKVAAPEPRDVPAIEATRQSHQSGTFADVRRFVVTGLVGITIVAAAWLWWLIDGGSSDSVDSEAANSGIRFISETLVTDVPGSHRQPAFSPDATSVAFVSDRSGTDQIWIRNLERGETVQLTSGEMTASFPSWSPSGDMIIYQRQRADGDSSIWSADPLGVQPPRMLQSRGSTPSYFPDGESFVFAIGRTLWVADTSGENRSMVPRVPAGPGFEARRSPAVSPDGKSIAFIHAIEGPAGGVWIMPAEGGEATPVTDMAALDPVWSADGRHIIFVSASGSPALSNTHLWRVPVDGGEPQQFTSGVGGYAFPAIAADGSRLLYTHGRAVWRLARTDSDSGAQSTLLESRASILLPRVSEDGRSVAYFTPADAGMAISTVGVDGEGRQQWTFDEGLLNLLPEWRDSDAIYYYKMEAPPGSPDSSLHRLTLSDGRDIEVASDFHFSTRNWLVAKDERIAFFHHNIQPDPSRTVVRNLADGTELILAVTFSPTDWSRDGERILGFSQIAERRQQIITCPANGNDECVVLEDEQGPILGREPRWSMDESRIFFTRSTDRPDYRELWVVDSEGSNLTLLRELGPTELNVSNSSIGIDHADNIIWTQFDLGGTAEIWMAELQ